MICCCTDRNQLFANHSVNMRYLDTCNQLSLVCHPILADRPNGRSPLRCDKRALRARLLSCAYVPCAAVRVALFMLHCRHSTVTRILELGQDSVPHCLHALSICKLVCVAARERLQQIQHSCDVFGNFGIVVCSASIKSTQPAASRHYRSQRSRSSLKSNGVHCQATGIQ